MKIEVFDGDQLVLNPFEYPLIVSRTNQLLSIFIILLNYLID